MIGDKVTETRLDPSNYTICPKLKEPYNQMLKTTCFKRQTQKNTGGVTFMYTACSECEKGKEILEEISKKEKETPIEEKSDIDHSMDTLEDNDLFNSSEPIQKEITKTDVSSWKCPNCKRGADVIAKASGTSGMCVTCNALTYKYKNQPELKDIKLAEFAFRVEKGIVKKYKNRKERKKVEKQKKSGVIPTLKVEKIIDSIPKNPDPPVPDKPIDNKPVVGLNQIVLTFETENEKELFERIVKFSNENLLYPHLDRQVLMILNRYLRKDYNTGG